MTLDFAPLAWVYFCIVGATLAITVISRNPALIFGALVMLASWLASNEIVRSDGYGALIGHDAVVCAILGVCVATVGRISGSRALAAVFGLFVANVVVDIFALALIYRMANVTRDVTMGYVYAINAIFVASCVVLGTAGVGTRLVHSGPPSRRRAGRTRQRGTAVVARGAGEAG